MRGTRYPGWENGFDARWWYPPNGLFGRGASLKATPDSTAKHTSLLVVAKQLAAKDLFAAVDHAGRRSRLGVIHNLKIMTPAMGNSQPSPRIGELLELPWSALGDLWPDPLHLVFTSTV